jgi:hypothetical protein
MNPTFRKSSCSDNNAAECLEIAGTLDAVRDSKNPATVLKIDLTPLLRLLGEESEWARR